MSELSKVLITINRKQELLNDLYELALEREESIARFFPGFAYTDNKELRRQVETEFNCKLEVQIIEATGKGLSKAMGG